MSKSLIILGASGSIGTQTLDILKKHPNDFILLGISIGKKTRKISPILRMFKSIKAICIQDKSKIKYYSSLYPNIKFFSGDSGLIDLINYTNSDMVVNALVGFVGLYPSIYTLRLNKKLALANKEALVVGGEIINSLLKQGYGQLFPIDSEHSALWKCLKVDDKNVDKLIITASGGAFRKLDRNELNGVKAEDALKHPTWKMGAKITIDCATMVNKSFEIIEAYYLFGYKFDKINVLLHDESHIHSMVKYLNGSYRAEISKPDMRNPIAFAIYEGNYPFKTYVANDYHKFGNYHFHNFISSRYPMVEYAKLIIDNGGTYGAVYNAANEVAVHAFLKGKISFLDIEKIINKAIGEHTNNKNIDYDLLKKVDILTRKTVNEWIETRRY